MRSFYFGTSNICYDDKKGKTWGLIYEEDSAQWLAKFQFQHGPPLKAKINLKKLTD